MNCIVNGEQREITEGTTVEQLIAQMGLEKSICAAEVDKNIVPRRERSSFEIQDGMSIEIVTLVGGG